MGFQAILVYGNQLLVYCRSSLALEACLSLPVLCWRTGSAGSGQQQVGPWAAAAHMVHLYPHFVRFCMNSFRQMKRQIQIIAKAPGNI